MVHTFQEEDMGTCLSHHQYSHPLQPSHYPHTRIVTR
jgi:hypothetical protein